MVIPTVFSHHHRCHEDAGRRWCGQTVPQARDHGRRGVRDADKGQPQLHGQLRHRRRGAAWRRRHRRQPVRRRPGWVPRAAADDFVRHRSTKLERNVVLFYQDENSNWSGQTCCIQKCVCRPTVPGRGTERCSEFPTWAELCGFAEATLLPDFFLDEALSAGVKDAFIQQGGKPKFDALVCLPTSCGFQRTMGVDSMSVSMG